MFPANAQADLNLRWAHISEGTFPDVAAYILKGKRNAGQILFLNFIQV